MRHRVRICCNWGQLNYIGHLNLEENVAGIEKRILRIISMYFQEKNAIEARKIIQQVELHMADYRVRNKI